MSHLITAQRAILGKRELTYGVDPTPTGGANYIEAYDPSMPSYEATMAERMPVRPEPGPISTIVGTGAYKLDLGCHLASSGTAGTVPPMADLLVACGLDETVTPATDVEYTPVTKFDGTEESTTLYDYLGGILHEGNGCRGNLQLEFPHDDIPTAKFSFQGNRVNPSDVVVPAVTVTAWRKPLHVNKANTQFSLHGETPVLHKLSLDLGNVVTWKDYANSAQQTRITGRAIKGSVSIEAALLADKDWYAAVRTHALGALQLVHGLVAGDTVEVGATQVQLLNPKPEDADGIQVLTFDLNILSGFYLKFS